MLEVNVTRALRFISSCAPKTIASAERLLPRFYESISPVFAYAVVDIAQLPPFGDDLARVLKGCSRAVLSAGTLGVSFDRALNAANVSSVADGLILDALGSEYAEQYCDEELFKVAQLHDYTLTVPYSPGYGDCPLSFSKVILNHTERNRRTGIYLTTGTMMNPTKSITRVSGILNDAKVKARQDKFGEADDWSEEDLEALDRV